MTAAPRGPIAACVFDVYGTLLDTGSAVAALGDELGPRADALSALWRRRQLEYTWLRTLMQRPAGFWQITQDALDHSLAALDLDAARLRAPLLAAYERLAPYPEVPAMLRALGARGMTAAVLSNGDPWLLERGLAAAGIADHLRPVLSVEAVGLFKPAPEVYLLATRALGLPPARIAFFSANAWDAHGAASFGLQAVWVNRTGAPPERLPGSPARTVACLAGVLDLIGAAWP